MQYIPNIVAFIHTHPTLEVICNILGLLWTVAVAVCIFTTKVTDEQLNKLPPRLAAFVRASRHFGLNTLPFLQEAWIVIRGAATASAALLVFLIKISIPVLTIAAIMSCGSSVHSIGASGSVSGSPNGDWGASVGVVITFARSLDTDAGALISADTQLTPTQSTEAQAAIRDGNDSLQVLQDGIGTYEQVKNASAQCAVVEAADAVITKRLHVLTLLQDFGVQIPAQDQAIIETIAMVVDAAAPAITAVACGDAGFARRSSRLAMVRAALRHQ